MPSASSTVSFALVVALVTVTPGLDTALVLRAALARGRVEAAAAGAGICVGVLAWAVAAATGVSALLAAFESAALALRLVGAAYVVVLGVRMVIGAVRFRGAAEAAPTEDGPTTSDPGRAFRSGLLTNLLNPKVGAFYVALLPQYLTGSGSTVVGGTVLGMVHVVETALWFTVVIVFADAVRRRLARRETERWIDGVTGLALVGFGFELARSARG